MQSSICTLYIPEEFEDPFIPIPISEPTPHANTSPDSSKNREHFPHAATDFTLLMPSILVGVTITQ